MSKQLSKPPLPQFLVALYLVKCKPASLSVQEYLASLQSCIKDGRRPDITKDSHAYIDTSTFWRDAYMKSEELQLQLRARVIEFEQAQETTRSQKGELSLKDRSKKRRRSVADLSSEEVRRCIEGILRDPPSDAHLDPSSFLYHFYTLRKLDSTGNFDEKRVVSIIPLICLDIRRLVISECASQDLTGGARTSTQSRPIKSNSQKFRLLYPGWETEFDVKLLAVLRLFPYIIKAFRQLGDVADISVCQNLVVYKFVELFRDILEQICTLAATSPNSRQEVPNRKTNPCKTRSKHNQRAASASTINFPDLKGPAVALCNLLLHMLFCFDSSFTAEKQVLEGFLFFLIRRTGILLRCFVFGDEEQDRFPTSDADSRKIAHSDMKICNREAKLQAPYLIAILTYAIPFYQRHQTSPQPFVKSCFPTVSPASRPTLSHPAAATLQSTLLTAVFGESATAGFKLDALHRPSTPSENLGVTTADIFDQEGGDVAEWFKKAVWEIVGWDVLAELVTWD